MGAFKGGKSHSPCYPSFKRPQHALPDTHSLPQGLATKLMEAAHAAMAESFGAGRGRGAHALSTPN